ncbi:uncharacterized protein LOC133204151 [Saccostrea echinata]|uniref:uncharacterized protein LOC133204151 n=1 Tax=Saccostrea echinata TaxID=191078 RepID=UPI002A82201C|nr:uncharacterized protein LOC133204151 [Saccostrea echinata]
MDVYTVIGFVTTFVSFITYTVSFSAPFWYYIDLDTQEVYGGMWQTCVSNYITKTCSNNVQGYNTGWKPAYQTFGCLALICVILNLILMIIFVFKWRHKDWLRKAIISVSFATAVMSFICVTIFAAKFRNPDYKTEDLSFCFYLAIIAILTSICTGVIVIVGKIKGE